MRQTYFCLMLALFVGSTCAGGSSADEALSLGYSEDTVIFPSQSDDCAEGVLVYNHDGSFENGYAWGFGGIEPPYYGAFGEAYELGPGEIVCGAYWLTHVYEWPEYAIDLYVWEGGVTREPDAVLCMVPDVVPENVPHWPDCGQNDIELRCCVEGEFTVGYWWGYPTDPRRLFICSDENGAPGFPWTCIAPGIGYPTGWQHPNVVFPECQSLGCGVYFGEGPSPSEGRTWGRVRALFREN